VVPGPAARDRRLLALQPPLRRRAPRHPSKSTRHPTIRRSPCWASTSSGRTARSTMPSTRRGAEGWHTDGAYDEEPIQGDPALCPGRAEHWRRHVLRQHGTRRTEAAAAAESSSSTDGRRVHLRGPAKGHPLLNEEDRGLDAGLPSDHPTHPETGRKGLYFDPGKILRSKASPRVKAVRGDRRADRGSDDPAERRVSPILVAQGDVVIWGPYRCSYHKCGRRLTLRRQGLCIHWRGLDQGSAGAQPPARRISSASNGPARASRRGVGTATGLSSS